MAEAVFLADSDGRFVATELARGPWDPNSQHGGAPAALLMRALERIEPVDRLLLARVTYEFLRPVPLGELSVSASVVRPGRRVRMLEAVLVAEETEVVRARAVQVARVSGAVPVDGAMPEVEGPDAGSPPSLEFPVRPMFGPDANEIRVVRGGFGGRGPGLVWFRLFVPVVAGEEPSPLQRLVAAADFGNGISSSLDWARFVFINPDLTVYVDREPAGEWIGLDSRTTIGEGGVGLCASVLFDERGRVGVAAQSLYVAER